MKGGASSVLAPPGEVRPAKSSPRRLCIPAGDVRGHLTIADRFAYRFQKVAREPERKFRVLGIGRPFRQVVDSRQYPADRARPFIKAVAKFRAALGHGVRRLLQYQSLLRGNSESHRLLPQSRSTSAACGPSDVPRPP